jgi:hypothetical protein
MRTEDVVQLYHYTPRGITTTAGGMKYNGVQVTTMCEIEIKPNGFRLCSESREKFLERTEEYSGNDEISTKDSLYSEKIDGKERPAEPDTERQIACD